jgi:hypothetical protein
MTGEIAIGGVYIPSLLLLGLFALIVMGLLTQLLQVIGAYRYVAYRPLVDLGLFILVLGGLVILSAPFGPHP